MIMSRNIRIRSVASNKFDHQLVKRLFAQTERLPDERPVSQRRLAILIGRLLVAVKDADRYALAPLERLCQRRLDIRRVLALFRFELIDALAEIIVSVTTPMRKRPFAGRRPRSARQFSSPRQWPHSLPSSKPLTRAIYDPLQSGPVAPTPPPSPQPTDRPDTSCEGTARRGSCGWPSEGLRSPAERSSRTRSCSRAFASSA